MADFQGWKNYETHALVLWLDNYETMYLHACALAKEAKEQSDEDKEEIAKDGYRLLGCAKVTFPREPHTVLADSLKDWLEEQMPEVEGVWADLLNAAFSEVDWFAVAEHYLTTVEEA